MQDAKAGVSLSREASKMFDRAVQGPMCRSLLLYFTYADFEESMKNYDAARSIYMRLLDVPGKDDKGEDEDALMEEVASEKEPGKEKVVNGEAADGE